MKTKNKNWFTLVELIIVMVILWILSTLWFVSYTSYLSWVRDTNRISQLKSISDALYVHDTKSSFPIPNDETVLIMSWSTQIATQWFFWSKALETVWYLSDWKDPKTEEYFSYYLTKNKKYFQLMWHLEENPETAYNIELNIFWKNKVQALDYSIKFPYVEWSKLWILTTDTNEPIQSILTWSLDISDVWTLNTYKSFLKTNEVVVWTWTLFSQLSEVARVWWKWYSSSWNTIFYEDLD